LSPTRRFLPRSRRFSKEDPAGAAHAARALMSLIGLIIVLVVIGVGLYLLNTYVPMAKPIKTIINVVVVLAVCLWLLNVFGLLDVGPDTRHLFRR